MSYPEQVIGLSDYMGGGGGRRSVADLILQSGRDQADSYARSGEIWRNAIGGAAGALSNGLLQYGKEQDDKKVSQAVQLATAPPTTVKTPGFDVQGNPTPDAKTQGPDVNQILNSLPPELRTRATAGIRDFQDYATKSQKAQLEVEQLKQTMEQKQQEVQQHAKDAAAMGAFHALGFPDQGDGGLGTDTFFFQQAKDAGLDVSQFAPFLAAAHEDFAKVKGDPQALAAFREHYGAQRKPVLQGLMQQGSAGVQKEFAPKTREVKTLNADGSETTKIVEDTPGQTFTGAPKQLEGEAGYIRSRFGANPTPDQILQGRAAFAGASRDPLTEAKTAAELANLKEKDQPMGVENDVKTTMSGKPYINLGLYATPSERDKAKREATAKGIMTVTKENADALESIDTARMNLGSMMDGIRSKLPKDAAGRLLGGAENKIEAYLQTDEDKAAFKTWRLNAISTIQAMGVKSRLNKVEIDAAVEGLPTITDTAKTADKKIADVTAMLDHKEQSVLTRDRSTLAPIPSPKPAGNGPAVGEQRVIQGKLARWDGKGWMAQ